MKDLWHSCIFLTSHNFRNVIQKENVFLPVGTQYLSTTGKEILCFGNYFYGSPVV